jgi:hypothetical protein
MGAVASRVAVVLHGCAERLQEAVDTLDGWGYRMQDHADGSARRGEVQ